MLVPTGLAGTLTIVCLVGLGIFLYPWLLRRRGGAAAVAAITAALAVVFFGFDASSGVDTATSATLGIVWALMPVVAGLIVKTLQDRKASKTKE